MGYLDCQTKDTNGGFLVKISYLKAKLAEIKEQLGDIEVGVITSGDDCFIADKGFLIDIVGIPNESETEEETIVGLF